MRVRGTRRAKSQASRSRVTTTLGDAVQTKSISRSHSFDESSNSAATIPKSQAQAEAQVHNESLTRQRSSGVTSQTTNRIPRSPSSSSSGPSESSWTRHFDEQEREAKLRRQQQSRQRKRSGTTHDGRRTRPMRQAKERPRAKSHNSSVLRPSSDSHANSERSSAQELLSDSESRGSICEHTKDNTNRSHPMHKKHEPRARGSSRLSKGAREKPQSSSLSNSEAKTHFEQSDSDSDSDSESGWSTNQDTDDTGSSSVSDQSFDEKNLGAF